MMQATVVGRGPSGLWMASNLRHFGFAVRVVADGHGTLPLWAGHLDFRNYDTLGRHVIRDPWRWWENAPSHEVLGKMSCDEWSQAWLALCQAWRIAGIPVSAILPKNNRWTLTPTGRLRPVFLAPAWQYVADEPESLWLIGLNGHVDTVGEWAETRYQSETGQDARVSVLPRPPQWHAGWTSIRWAAWLETAEGLQWLLDQLDREQSKIPRNWPVVVPQVLGIRRTESIIQTMEQRLQRYVREYPLPAPAIGGMRIDERWTRWLRQNGVDFLSGHVTAITEGRVMLSDGRYIPSDVVVRASGGILGGGLIVMPDGRVIEPICGAVRGTITDESPWEEVWRWGDRAVEDKAVGRQVRGADPDVEGNGGAWIVGSVSLVTASIREEYRIKNRGWDDVVHG